jgi:hypothetical protein
MLLDTLREWLGVLAEVLTALFAGLVWWLTRRYVNPGFEIVIESGTRSQFLTTLRIVNPTPYTVFIDEIRAHAPRRLRLARPERDPGDPHGLAFAARAWSRAIVCPEPIEVPPNGATSVNLFCSLISSRRSVMAITIGLNIRTRWRVVRHRRKAATAMLPPMISSHQA